VREIEVQSKRLESGNVDLTGVHDPDAVAPAIREVCDTDRLWQVTLGGNPEFAPDVESIASTLTAAYGYIDVRDGTSLAESHVLAERCEEETVRGEFFRRLTQVRSTAPDDREKEVAERAIKIGLGVFG